MPAVYRREENDAKLFYVKKSLLLQKHQKKFQNKNDFILKKYPISINIPSLFINIPSQSIFFFKFPRPTWVGLRNLASPY